MRMFSITDAGISTSLLVKPRYSGGNAILLFGNCDRGRFPKWSPSVDAINPT